MNRANLKHQIATLRSVEERDKGQDHGHFSMGTWVNNTYSTPIPTFEECGTVACAFGWESLTLYAHNRGLKIGLDWVPRFKRKWGGTGAAARYFDIPVDIANNLFLPDDYEDEAAERYGEITPQDVIDRIELLLAIGEADYLDAIHGEENDWSET